MSSYTPTGNPVAETRGVSAQVRAEFSLIQTAVNSKGDTAGQAWTGTHNFSGATAVTLPAATTIGTLNFNSLTATIAELNYMTGVTSNVQTQLDSKQAVDADLTALAGVSTTGLLVRTGSGTAAARTLTAGLNVVITNGDGVSGNPTIAVTPGTGTGDVIGPAASVDSEIALFSSTTGKIIKRASITGIAKVTSGVLSAGTAGTDYVAPGTATTFTATQTFKGVTDTVYTITDGAAFEINPNNGSIQVVTLGANRTPAATNFAAGQCVLLGIDDGTAYSVTWTTVAVTWVKSGGSATAPTLATSGYTWVLLWKAGSTIYGTLVGSP